MGQAASFCTSCCPCPRRRKRRGVAVPGAGEGKRKLLPPSSGKSHKPLGKESKYRRPPSHLREVSGDINQVVRLVLVGGCATGKTCLLRRFLGGYFDEAGEQDYTRTLGVDFGCKTIELGDRRVRLQMWDTGGSETYRSVVSHYLRGADGAILCFDVSRKATLRALRSTWAPFLDKHTPRTCRVLLVGNKADCRGAKGVESAGVLQEDAKRFADAIEAQVFETSAKLGTNIDSAVLALMREVLHHREFAAQDQGDASKEGSSPRRKGRRRLSVALKDALGTTSEGDTSSSCASHDGKGRRSAQAYSSDENATEATTSSAGSSSASHRDGDNSDQDSSKTSRNPGNHSRAWVPFPVISDAVSDDVSALGSSIEGGRSVTSARESMASSMDIGLGLLARGGGRLESSRRVSEGSGFKAGGRYQLINQLAITSASRETSIDGLGIDMGGKCSGGEGGDRSPRREREGTTLQALDSGGEKSGGRKAHSQTLNALPKPGIANVPTSARPRRPVPASHSDPPPRIAVGPTVLVVDERRSLEDGDMAKAAGGSTPAYRGTSTAKTRDASPPQRPTDARLTRSSEAKVTEINFHVRGAGLRSSPTSSSSSVSTVVVGDDARYQLASPVADGGYI